MASIIYVGMDVHTTNFTFCCYTADSDRGFAVAQTEPDYRQVIKYMERVQKQRGEECKFVCGYEAGCLGYSLYHQLARCGVDCVRAPGGPLTCGNQSTYNRVANAGILIVSALLTCPCSNICF